MNQYKRQVRVKAKKAASKQLLVFKEIWKDREREKEYNVMIDSVNLVMSNFFGLSNSWSHYE